MLESALGWHSSKPRGETLERQNTQPNVQPLPKQMTNQNLHQGKGHENRSLKQQMKAQKWQTKRANSGNNQEGGPNTKNPRREEQGNQGNQMVRVSGGNREPIPYPQENPSTLVREKVAPVRPDGKPRWTHCFNCREEGHFARECPKQNMMRLPSNPKN